MSNQMLPDRNHAGGVLRLVSSSTHETPEPALRPTPSGTALHDPLAEADSELVARPDESSPVGVPLWRGADASEKSVLRMAVDGEEAACEAAVQAVERLPVDVWVDSRCADVHPPVRRKLDGSRRAVLGRAPDGPQFHADVQPRRVSALRDGGSLARRGAARGGVSRRDGAGLLAVAEHRSRVRVVVKSAERPWDLRWQMVAAQWFGRLLGRR
jgi:hypothetical protein